MDGPVKSGAGLDVSVSFGRFENDELSWEKWSSFSPNKYLEEAGTLSTPGSVAQKKAYFEAHYRKIAARKTEEFEQEKLMSLVTSNLDASKKESCAANSSELVSKFGMWNGERLAEEVAHESCITLLPDGGIVHEAEGDNSVSRNGDEQAACINDLSEAMALDALKEDTTVSVTCGSSAVEETKNDGGLDGNMEESKLDIRKVALSVGSETLQKGSQHTVEKPPGRKNGTEQSRVLKNEKSKLSAQNTAGKITPSKKSGTVAGTMKKGVSPATKQSQISTPRYSKLSSTPTPVSVSKNLKKQVNGPRLMKSKDSLVGESKRSAPTSLHMSLSLGSTKSFSAISTTRKSLIMEKMGDKDIVKRAFRSFQSRANRSDTEGKAPTIKHQTHSAPFESKISASCTPTQGHERLRKDSGKRATQSSQSGARSNALPKGLHRSTGADRNSTATLTLTTGTRNLEKTEKGKEFLRKLEAKSIVREAGATRLAAKSKVHLQNGIDPQPTLIR